MAIMQKVTTVKAKVYPQPIPDIIEWVCPECGQGQKEVTYHVEDFDKLQCERCNKIFTREK